MALPPIYVHVHMHMHIYHRKYLTAAKQKEIAGMALQPIYVHVHMYMHMYQEVPHGSQAEGDRGHGAAAQRGALLQVTGRV